MKSLFIGGILDGKLLHIPDGIMTYQHTINVSDISNHTINLPVQEYIRVYVKTATAEFSFFIIPGDPISAPDTVIEKLIRGYSNRTELEQEITKLTEKLNNTEFLLQNAVTRLLQK